MTTVLFLNSNKASKVTNNGSTLFFNLDSPIDLAEFKAVRCLKSAIPFSTPNISSALGNNTLTFTYNSITYVITIDDGIYDDNAINEIINDYAIDNGLPSSPTIFSFEADTSTGKIGLYINTLSPFSISTTQLIMHDFFGFTQAGPLTSSGATDFFQSASIANINNITAIYLNVSFVSSSTVYFGNSSSCQVVQEIIPNVEVGSYIITSDYNPLHIKLFKGKISQFNIFLTDQNGKYLNILNQSFSCILELL